MVSRKELEVNKMSLSLFIDIIDKFLIDSKGEPLTMKISDMTIDDFIKINIIFAEKFTTDDRTIEYDEDDLNVINNLLNEHTDNTVNMHTVVEGNKIFFILEPGSTNFIRSASIATKLPYFEFILNKLHDLYSNADMYKSKCFQKYLSIV